MIPTDTPWSGLEAGKVDTRRVLAAESAYMGEESGTPAPPELESLAAALGVELPKPEEEEDEDEDELVDVPERPGPPNYW